MKLTPIVIFAYNRESHFKRVSIAIQKNKIRNKIYFFLDGPKNNRDKVIQENILIGLKRLGKYNKFQKNQIKIFKNKKNLGLARSINKGLDKISKLHDSFIVLEDDTVPYSNLIKFFSNCINKYKKEKNIGAICGYQFLNFEKNPKVIESKFLRNFIPWGWATWSVNWKKYRKYKIKSYSDKRIPYFIKKLYKDILRKNRKANYWSLNFMFYHYINSNFFIFPNVPLIKNIGFDGSGTNCYPTNDLNVYEKNINKINLGKFRLNPKEINKQENFLKKVIKKFYN